MFSFLAWFIRSRPAAIPLPVFTADITFASQPSISQKLRAAWQSFVMAIIFVFSCGVSSESNKERGIEALATQSSSFYVPEFRSNASISVPSVSSLPSSYSYQSRIQTERRGLRMDAHRSAHPRTGSSPYVHYSASSGIYPRPMPLDLEGMRARSHMGDRIIIREEPIEVTVTPPPIAYEPGRPSQPSRLNGLSVLNQSSPEPPPSGSNNRSPMPITPPPSPKPIASTPVSHSTPHSTNPIRPLSKMAPGDIHGGICHNKTRESDVQRPTASNLPPIQSAEITYQRIQDIHDSTSDKIHTSNQNTPRTHVKIVSRPVDRQQTISSITKLNEVSGNSVPPLESKVCVFSSWGIPIIRVYRPDSSIAGARPAMTPTTLKDDRSSTSPHTSLFDSVISSSTSAVNSVEVPDSIDRCRPSVSRVSTHSQDNVPSNTSIPERNGQVVGLDSQDTQMSMVSISKVLEGYCGESNEHVESGNEYHSSACSIISGGVVQNQISMGLSDETFRLTTESRQKSKLAQPIRPVQEIMINPIIPKSDVKSKADGDSSLPANNSSTTVSVESDQFRYDENCIQESDPKGTFTMPMTKSSSHLALLTALGLITKPDPEDLVTIPSSVAKLQPSIKANKSNYLPKYASTGKAPVVAIPSTPGHHKGRAPLRIIVPDAWSKVNKGMPYLTSPTSSPPYFDCTSGLGAKCSLPTPPCTPVESMGPYRTQDPQQSLTRSSSTSRLPSGIPSRRASTPILSNQENKRETSSTTSSRLKSNLTGIQALNPDLTPPVPGLPPTSSKRLPRPTKFTESGALTGSLGKGSQAPSGPRIKVPTRATITQSSPASVDNCSSRNLRPLGNTRQMIPASISSANDTLIRGTSNNILVQSHLQSVLPTNVTRPIAFNNPTSKPATGELNHARHGSIRSRRAVGLKHESVTSTKRHPSRTSNQENISALTVTRLVPPNAIALSSGIKITGRQRGTQEDAVKFVPDKTFPTENHSRTHSGQATPVSRPQIPLSRDLNRRKVRSTNVWI